MSYGFLHSYELTNKQTINSSKHVNNIFLIKSLKCLFINNIHVSGAAVHITKDNKISLYILVIIVSLLVYEAIIWTHFILK